MKWEKILPWHRSFKFNSQKVFSVIGLLPIAYLTLPEEWRELIVEHPKVILVFSGLAMLGFILRNLKQADKNVANADAKVLGDDS